MNKSMLVAAALATVLASPPAAAETLRDAVEAAYLGNPTLAAARARQDALAETPEQARAAGRITAAADGAAGYDRFDYDRGAGGTVSASLPIWTGGRIASGVRAADRDVAAGQEGLRDAEAGLLTQVVGVYAELLYDQQAVEIGKADIALLDHQVAEAQARYRLGKATRTDVAQLEAQRASAGATLAAAQAKLDGAAADYRAVVGHDPGALAPPAALGPLPATLEQARADALDANPLYQQSLRAADAAGARIQQARAGGAPTVSLGGGYGYDVGIGGAGPGSFLRAANVGLTLHVPLLTGGLVASQVRQAQAQHRATMFDAAAAGREATRSTDAAWAALSGAKAQMTANQAGVDAANLALGGVRAEYGFDLRSTLDILVADESLRSAQLALARNRSDTIIAQAALLRATGHLDHDAIPGP
ncbi:MULTISPECIES: TolC family outer membrane protein [unclassified Novosphingobium]|uniref:TolC family outer membrane protein n=1 Tax=unclassified Novosphingobium TaxID=2644732 RepID=UPI00146A92E3|nr:MULTISPECIES: TolC family outer membrane protein [unclassified Novosphingobium]NMN06169.1 outer membrane protein [Novosphingobium sp. SG919]NMN88466.1 outer membrane protein [Novosphingobium sp. SG916]